MKASRWIALVVVTVSAVIVTATALGGSSSSKAPKSSFKAALVSDVIGFNDAGFNRNQLKGLNLAVKKVGGTAIPEVSHATSDYAPNFNDAIRKGANIVVAAIPIAIERYSEYVQQVAVFIREREKSPEQDRPTGP